MSSPPPVDAPLPDEREEEPPSVDEVRFEAADEVTGLDHANPFPERFEWQLEAEAGGGGALADLDDDGDLDVVLTALNDRNGVFLNDGSGAFTRVEDSGLESGLGTHAVTSADFNGDRYPDLLLHDVGSVRLFEGSGDGRFNELMPLVEFGDDLGSVGAAITDADGDGDLDIYLMIHERIPSGSGHDGLQGAHDMLFLGAGDMVWEDAGHLLPDSRQGATFAATWIDIDEDDDLDLYVVRDHGERLAPNALFLNPGTPETPWAEAAGDFGLDVAMNAMGIAWGDIDGLHGAEIVISDTRSTLRTLSMLDGYGTDVTHVIGSNPDQEAIHRIGWGTELVDVDDDGDLDLLAAWGHKDYNTHDEPPRPQPMSLHINAGGRLHDRSRRLPPALGAFHRGVLYGDLDGDGTLDVLTTSLFGPTMVLAGVPTDNHHLEVRLDSGDVDNRDGLGSVVEVTMPDGTHQRRMIAAGATGVHSSLPPVARFGLGSQAPDRVSVQWPDGSRTDVSVDDVDRQILVGRDGLLD